MSFSFPRLNKILRNYLMQAVDLFTAEKCKAKRRKNDQALKFYDREAITRIFPRFRCSFDNSVSNTLFGSFFAARVAAFEMLRKIDEKLIMLPPVENRVIDVSNIIQNTCLIITCRGKSCFRRLSGTFSQFSLYQFNNLHFLFTLFTFLRTFPSE